MAIQRILEGVSGKSAADTIYTNDLSSWESAESAKNGVDKLNNSVYKLYPFEQLVATFTFGAIRKVGTADNTAVNYKRTTVTGVPFRIPQGKEYFYTGTIDNAEYAGVVFLGATFNVLGYSCGEVRSYSRERLYPPADAVYLAACSLGGDAVIESNKEVDRVQVLEDKVNELEKFTSPALLYLSGNGAPPYMYGIDNVNYLDAITGRLYTKRGGRWDAGKAPQVSERPFTIPAEFIFSPLEIYKQKNGMYQPKGLENITLLVQDDIIALTPVFVDPVNGNNTNSGILREDAFKTIPFAISNGHRLIIMLSGFYDRSATCPDLSDTDAQLRPLLLLADAGAKVVWSSADSATLYNWTPDGGLFKCSRSNTLSVLDISVEDPITGYLEFKNVDSVELCRSTLDSWFLDGSDLYVNTRGVPPSENIKICLSSTLGTLSPSVDIPYFYVEGVDSYTNNPRGGVTIRSNTVDQFNTVGYLKNVRSFNNKLGNAISLESIKKSFAQNCFGGNCKSDALNYHTTYAGFEKMEAVEINCSSLNTGGDFPAEVSSNGSTAHDGIKIVRFGGNFDLSRGSTVIDVNEGTMSLNLNTQARRPYPNNQACFSAGLGAKMWLFDCTTDNSTNAATANGGGEIKYDSETLLLGAVNGDATPI